MEVTTSSPVPEQQVAPEWRSKILHASMKVGDAVLMGSDAPPDRQETQTPKGFSVSLNLKSPADAERIFKALEQNGKVTMPMEPTFWAARFGMLVDQFGIPWMVNCEPPAS